MTAKFEETKQFNGSCEELFLKSVEAIKLSGFKLIKADRASGHIEAKVGRSLDSLYGENISIEISQNGNFFIQSIFSLPTVILDIPGVIVDFHGKNKKNVNKFWRNLYPLLTEEQSTMPLKDFPSFASKSNISMPTNSVLSKHYKIFRELDIEEDAEILSVDELPLDNRFGSNDLTLEQEFSKTITNEIFLESTQEEKGKLTVDIFKLIQAELTLDLSKKVGHKHGESTTCRYTTTISVKKGDFIIYKITWKRKIRRSKYEIQIDNQLYVIPSVARYGVEYEITSSRKGKVESNAGDDFEH